MNHPALQESLHLEELKEQELIAVQPDPEEVPEPSLTGQGLIKVDSNSTEEVSICLQPLRQFVESIKEEGPLMEHNFHSSSNFSIIEDNCPTGSSLQFPS